MDKSNTVSGIKLNLRQRHAALLLAKGVSLNKIALDSNVKSTPGTIRKWMDNPDFMRLLRSEQDALLTEFRQKLTAAYITGAASAVRVMKEQMQPGNEPYVRQNAAREMLNKFHQVMDKDEQKAVEIVFTGMPQIGSPAQDDSVHPDGNETINRLLNT